MLRNPTYLHFPTASPTNQTHKELLPYEDCGLPIGSNLNLSQGTSLSTALYLPSGTYPWVSRLQNTVSGETCGLTATYS